MKKIISIAVAVLSLAVGFSSCDISREPQDNDFVGPIVSVQDAKQKLDGIYSVAREAENPTRFVWQEIQSDIYSITSIDGNTSSRYLSWDLPAIESGDETANYYFRYNKLVQSANYFVDEGKIALEKGVIKLEAEVKLMNQYIAEVQVLQALAYSRLMERFAYKYDAAETQAPKSLGMILVKKYDPMFMGPRNTQIETYDYILSRIEEALPHLLEKPASNVYLGKDFALGLRARVYLNMGNYQAAANDVEAFYTKYKLIDAVDTEKFEEIYRSQANNPELIFRAEASINTGSVTETLLNGASVTGKKVNYSPNQVPLQWIVDLYNADDFRKEVYIAKEADKKKGYLVNKFLGDPALREAADRPNLKVASRFFTLPEAYLILAECKIKLGDEATAMNLLKTLSSSRGVELTETDAMTALQNERTREMIGEGSRLNDMIRWNLPLVVSPIQPALEGYALPKVLKAGDGSTIPAGFYAFTWEFPVRDRQVNKDLIRNW